MKGKLILALVLAAGIAAWMLSGEVIVSGVAEEAAVRPPAERSQAQAEPFRVRVRTIEAVERRRSLTMRGETEADALVRVAAETSGRVEERPVSYGSQVKPGDVLCRLDQGVRAAQLAQAKADLERAQLEYDAATQLRGRGFESETRVATTRAALHAAEAAVAAAEEELARTVIRAPIAGTIEQPIAEIGETLSIGDTCATIVDADPILVTGQVTERDVSDIELGTVASVELVTGEKAEGEVTFVSRTADPDTRTFTVEITLANADGALRAGVTAEARIPLQPARVHRLSPGVLTLADSGEVGVRTVDDEGRVAFRPVEIAMQDTEGFWVTGLPQTVTVITVGQDFVVEGQIVEPVKDTEDA